MLFLFSDMLLYAAFTRGKSSVSRALSGGDLLPRGNVFPPYGTSADDVDAATFQFRRKFDLEFVRVVDVEDGWLASTVVGSPSSVASRPPLLHCFQVQTVEKSFAVVCRNAKDKEAWMTAIDGAVRAFLRNRSTLKLEEDRESGGTRAAGMSVEHSDSGTGDVEATSGMASLQVAPVWVRFEGSCVDCRYTLVLLS